MMSSPLSGQLICPSGESLIFWTLKTNRMGVTRPGTDVEFADPLLNREGAEEEAATAVSVICRCTLPPTTSGGVSCRGERSDGGRGRADFGSGQAAEVDPVATSPSLGDSAI